MWYTNDSGTIFTFQPRSCMRQQRSISSMCAKKRSSNPPRAFQTLERTIRHAPLAHKTSAGESYCPLSFSILCITRPRQKG